MKSTRKQIVDLLENQDSATAVELSQVLLLSAADVRHHLLALRREGVIEAVKEKSPLANEQEGSSKRPVGRPPQRYRLSARARADRFDRLAEALLEEILDEVPPHEKEALLRRIAARMAGSAKPGGSLASRLVQAVQQLNELHYEASWEARPGDPQVKLSHCPYAAILPQHPELCQLDAELLETMVGVPAVQTARQARDASGARYCRFVIGKMK
jgi:predicted ArsR family transcriptional regulator